MLRKDSSFRNKYLVGCLLNDEGVRNDGEFFSQRTIDGLFGRVPIPTWSIDIALLQVHNNSNVDRYPGVVAKWSPLQPTAAAIP